VAGEEENIKEVIDLLGLSGKEDVLTSHLCLYDKKLTMLAVALATKPKLLLVDEPIGGLSPTETKQFMGLIQKINKESGLTIIIIEHLMKALTALSKRMMIIENGKRIALDTPEKVCCDERVIETYLGRGKHA
jgi:branched-chain amino acid transport system ATP-binding protein